MTTLPTARIAEQFFRELLHETAPVKAVHALADTWAPRATPTGTWLGMSKPEHHVTMALVYVGEVGNGGHEQFFSNRGGEIAARARMALHDVGLVDMEEILEMAVATFPGGQVPAEPAEVDRLFASSTEGRLDELDRLDQQLWRLDAYPRLLAYLREHEGEVLRPERGLEEREAP